MVTPFKLYLTLQIVYFFLEVIVLTIIVASVSKIIYDLPSFVFFVMQVIMPINSLDFVLLVQVKTIVPLAFNNIKFTKMLGSRHSFLITISILMIKLLKTITLAIK